MLKLRKLALCVALGSLVSGSVLAGPYAFNARQDAMGGAGVSSANYLSAPFYNPALLALSDDSDQVGLLLPVVGAEVFDKDDLRNQVDDFNTTYDEFTAAYDAYGANQSQANKQRLESANTQAMADLQQLSGATGYARAGAGAAVALPFSALSGALFLNGYADAQAFTDVSKDDFTPYDYKGVILTVPRSEEAMNSQVIGMAAVVSDLGFSLAKSFQDGEMTWAVGVTPKLQTLKVYNYVANASDSDLGDMTDSQYENKKNTFNLDAGLAANWSNGWSSGLAIKNLIKQELDAPKIGLVQSTYQLSPIPTASLSYRLAGVLLTGDVDLLAQKRFTALTGTHATYHADHDDLQPAALGLEWDVLGWLQLRTGYRHDLQSNLDDAFTAGFGLAPFEMFHLDLAGIYAGNDEFGGVLQTSFTF